MINLYVSYYIDPREDRAKELDACLKTNLSAGHFDTVTIFTDVPGEEIQNRFAGLTASSNVIFNHELPRPTFGEMFSVARSMTGSSDAVHVFANSDIVFDSTIIAGAKTITNKQAFALTRWDMTADHRAVFYDHADSQDVWLLKGSIPEIPGANFTMGKAGCLAGDTIIGYKRGKRDGSRLIRLKDLYTRFNGFSDRWDLSLPTFSQSLDISSGYLRYNRINEVIQSGVKDVIKISFSDDTSITLTPDHPIAIPGYEFIPAENLSVGDIVLARGHMRPMKIREKRIRRQRDVEYIKYHPFAEHKNVRGHKYMRLRTSRLSVEAEMNGMQYDEYVDCLKNDIARARSLRFLPTYFEVHHIDEDTTNNHASNLRIVTPIEHCKIHATDFMSNRQHTIERQVTRIESAGSEMTYDLQMQAPHNNFIGNGVIVHNCDNKIAYLLKQSGYKVLNPSKDIRTYHMHLSGVRNYSVVKDRKEIRPPFLTVTPCRLNDCK